MTNKMNDTYRMFQVQKDSNTQYTFNMKDYYTNSVDLLSSLIDNPRMIKIDDAIIDVYRNNTVQKVNVPVYEMNGLFYVIADALQSACNAQV